MTTSGACTADPVNQKTLKLESERRDEPRYPVSNIEASLVNEEVELRAVVVDLSLNGALLMSTEPLGHEPGVSGTITVKTSDDRSFIATAHIVHCTECRIGIEFLAFDPSDFEVLSDLITELRRSRVANLLNANRV